MKKFLTILYILGMCMMSFAQWTTTGSDIYNSNAGNVGIGITSPEEKLQVAGGIKVTASMYANTASSGGIDFYGGYTRFHTWGPDIYTHGGYKFTMNASNGNPYTSLIILPTGEVGIGTTSPAEKLQIAGGIKVTGSGSTNAASSGGMDFLSGYTQFNSWGADIYTHGGYKFIINVSNGNSYTPLIILPTGNLGIGTNDPGAYKLAVNGNMRAKEIKVETGWSDFVFEPSYKLRSLKETEQFIKENKYLPEIPSAKEVVENGINLGEMNAKLLQKIEELTLYLIEHNKDIKDIKTSNEQLKNEITQLKSKL